MEIYHLVDVMRAEKVVIVDDNRCEYPSLSLTQLFLPLIIFAFHLVSFLLSCSLQALSYKRKHKKMMNKVL